MHTMAWLRVTKHVTNNGGLLVNSEVSEHVVALETDVWAEARLVWARLTEVHCSVSLSTHRVATNNALPLLSLVQEMEPSIQSLRIGRVWMGSFPRTAYSRTLWSRSKISGGQGFDNGAPVSDVRLRALLYVSVQCIAVGNGNIQEPKKDLTPPLDSFAYEWVGHMILVGDINTIHVLVVGVHCQWFLLLSCLGMSRWYCDHLC